MIEKDPSSSWSKRDRASVHFIDFLRTSNWRRMTRVWTGVRMANKEMPTRAEGPIWMMSRTVAVAARGKDCQCEQNCCRNAARHTDGELTVQIEVENDARCKQ